MSSVVREGVTLIGCRLLVTIICVSINCFFVDYIYIIHLLIEVFYIKISCFGILFKSQFLKLYYLYLTNLNGIVELINKIFSWFLLEIACNYLST